MKYSAWLKNGDLTNRAFDWAVEFADNYTGNLDENSIYNALPDEMPSDVKAAMLDVILGMATGGAVMVQPEGKRNQQ